MVNKAESFSTPKVNGERVHGNVGLARYDLSATYLNAVLQETDQVMTCSGARETESETSDMQRECLDPNERHPAHDENAHTRVARSPMMQRWVQEEAREQPYNAIDKMAGMEPAHGQEVDEFDALTRNGTDNATAGSGSCDHKRDSDDVAR